MTKVNSIFVQITRECNFDCAYCPYSRNNAAMNRDMNFKTQISSLKKVLSSKQFSKDSFNTLVIYGGECLLHIDQIHRVIRAYLQKRKNGSVYICTNGLALDENRIKEFSNYTGIEFGIGMDGDFDLVSSLKTIDHRTYKHLLRVLSLLRAYKIPYDFSTTITPEFMKTWDAQIKFLLRLKPKLIGFNVVRDTEHQKMLGIRDARAYMQKALAHMYDFKSKKNYNYLKKKSCIERNEQVGDCVCSGFSVTITAEGYYTTCGIFGGENHTRIRDVVKQFHANYKKLFETRRISKDVRSLPTFGGGCSKISSKENDLYVQENARISFNALKNEKI